MNNYNQYTNKETKMWCTIVSLLNIMLYRYAIRVEPNFIIKLAIFFDKLWTFFIWSGAIFSIIDNQKVTWQNGRILKMSPRCLMMSTQTGIRSKDK